MTPHYAFDIPSSRDEHRRHFEVKSSQCRRDLLLELVVTMCSQVDLFLGAVWEGGGIKEERMLEVNTKRTVNKND